MQSPQPATERPATPAYAATQAAAERTRAVLEISGLRTYLFTRSGVVKGVDDVSFSVRRGETLAVVGESGCGKTMTALSIMRIVPAPPGKICGGRVTVHGNAIP